jgi:hypothetical protein
VIALTGPDANPRSRCGADDVNPRPALQRAESPLFLQDGRACTTASWRPRQRRGGAVTVGSHDRLLGGSEGS